MKKSLQMTLIFAALCGGLVLPICAHEHTTRHSTAALTDTQAIEHSMKKLFDKPEAPLTVLPVTLEGDYAVAGWIQSGKGGRALLKKEHGAWRIQVCGGDGLKQASTLSLTGMSNEAAERLAKKVKSQEAKLSAEQVKKLSMFEGVTNVESSGHDAHAAHPKH